MKVLIVDDEKLIINLLKLLLEKIEGVEVESAINEDEAKKKFDKSFDLLIIDKNLGKTSGLELANIFKCKNNFLRILLISGDASIQRNYTGIDYILLKPFQNDEFIKIINKVKDDKIMKIAKICHEINQPAMAILGISEILINKYNDKRIHTLKEQAERLSKILNKLSYALFDNK